MNKVALLTGAYKGLGLETARRLAADEISVILTSRDPDKGKAAAGGLADRGLAVAYHPLDVTREEQWRELRQWIEGAYGRLDILINNAGVLFDRGTDGDPAHADPLQATASMLRETMETNLCGPFLACQTFLPLMQKNNYGRIVNISSSLAQLAEMGCGYNTYRISKTALNALTRVFASAMAGHNLLINSVCPGWCKTDMGGPHAPRPVEKGAEVIYWAATLPDGGPTGGFFRDKKPIAW